MGNKHHHVLKQHGQSTVEYILLLAVVISLAYLVINSQAFKNLLGQNGSFATQMKNEAEWNYRFGSQGRDGFSTINYGATHPTYWNAQKGMTHFIGPKDKYPK